MARRAGNPAQAAGLVLQGQRPQHPEDIAVEAPDHHPAGAPLLRRGGVPAELRGHRGDAGTGTGLRAVQRGRRGRDARGRRPFEQPGRDRPGRLAHGPILPGRDGVSGVYQDDSALAAAGLSPGQRRTTLTSTFGRPVAGTAILVGYRRRTEGDGAGPGKKAENGQVAAAGAGGTKT